jgi:hypothetical protein
MKKDEICIETLRLAEQIERIILYFVEKQQTQAIASASSSPGDWMTITELAEYWRLFDKDRTPVTAGIKKWVNRSADEHPLPQGCMGDLPRFKREAVDRWAEEEAELRRAEKERRRLKLAS